MSCMLIATQTPKLSRGSKTEVRKCQTHDYNCGGTNYGKTV